MTGRLSVSRVRERLRGNLWFLPAVLVLGSAALAVALLTLDNLLTRSFDSRFVFGGGASGARQLITTVAGSMVSFIGTVFPVTMIVLQLASTQFSPRLLRHFLRDRRTQLPLGVFLGTLVYALVVLWSIHVSGEDTRPAFVPTLAISGAYVLVFASLITFVFYIHHVSQSIRVANIVHQIGHEGLRLLDRRYAERFEPARRAEADAQLRGGAIVPSEDYGVLLAVDREGLVARAREFDGRVELLPRVGEFIAQGAPIARWTGSERGREQLGLRRFVSLGRERTMEQDLAFAFRQLVDIAEKALSPGINDPTTASQALDQVHNLLRQLVQRSFPDEVLRDADGTPRLVLNEHSWEAFVQLSIEEVRELSGASIQVRERLRSLLEDLEAAAPAERKAAVVEQRRLLEQVAPSDGQRLDQ